MFLNRALGEFMKQGPLGFLGGDPTERVGIPLAIQRGNLECT